MVVTQARTERLRACGRFERVTRLAPLGEVEGPFDSPCDPVPAELILEGDLQIFYVERSPINHPFLPVKYHANPTMQLCLCDSRTGTVIRERTVEAIGEFCETAAADPFKDKQTLMTEAATMALQAGVEKFARQLPSADRLKARWPRTPSRGPGTPAPAPR